MIRICSKGLQRAEEWSFDTAQKKSITQSFAFFKGERSKLLLQEWKAYLSNNMLLAMQLSLVDMQGMVNVVYTELPTAQDPIC